MDKTEPKVVIVIHPTWGKVEYVEGCFYCQREKDRGEGFFPRHTPSQKGHEVHCACDVCF